MNLFINGHKWIMSIRTLLFWGITITAGSLSMKLKKIEIVMIESGAFEIKYRKEYWKCLSFKTSMKSENFVSVLILSPLPLVVTIHGKKKKMIKNVQVYIVHFYTSPIDM